jgi:nicotinamide riboside transporter PnuC
MVEILGIIATVLAVGGVWLNNRQRIACFKLWIVSNLLSLGIHCSTGIWTLAIRDAIFVYLAFEGIRLWKIKNRIYKIKDEEVV